MKAEDISVGDTLVWTHRGGPKDNAKHLHNPRNGLKVCVEKTSQGGMFTTVRFLEGGKTSSICAYLNELSPVEMPVQDVDEFDFNAEYASRLRTSAALLTSMSEGLPESNKTRMLGKAAGVKMALSYFEEMVRTYD